MRPFRIIAISAGRRDTAAFSIGVSQRDATIEYIRTQPEHHRRRTFQEEFREFLTRHGFEYDERYVWD